MAEELEFVRCEECAEELVACPACRERLELLERLLAERYGLPPRRFGR